MKNEKGITVKKQKQKQKPNIYYKTNVELKSILTMCLCATTEYILWGVLLQSCHKFPVLEMC